MLVQLCTALGFARGVEGPLPRISPVVFVTLAARRSHRLCPNAAAASNVFGDDFGAPPLHCPAPNAKAFDLYWVRLGRLFA